MDDVNDLELLRDYDRQGSEAAFATLVARHVNLVYSAAFRHTGNAAHAEEITQAVFVILARKAGGLRPDTVLEGWLYQTTRLASLSFLRGERRRQLREQEAYMQSTLADSTEPLLWHQLAPLLDDAMAQLRAGERDAIVLRYFQNKSLRDVGASLGVDEYAAQKRIGRALEKLRKFFAKRGAITTGETIAGVISANYLQAAPVALAKSVTALAVTKGVAVGGSTLTLINGALKLMAWPQAKNNILISAGFLLAAGIAFVAVLQIEKPSARADTATKHLVFEGAGEWKAFKFGEQSEDHALTFRACVGPSKDYPWIIELRYPNPSVDEFVLRRDGSNIVSIGYFKPEYQKTLSGYGYAEKTTIPRGDGYLPVSAIWLAFEAPWFLDTLATNRISPPYFKDFRDGYLGYNLTVPFEVTRQEIPPKFVASMNFLHDGFVLNDERQRMQLPKPFDRGFTNAIFKVIRNQGGTNFGGTVPAEFSLDLFYPFPREANTPGPLYLVQSCKLWVTNFYETNSTAGLFPEIPTRISYQDRRFMNGKTPEWRFAYQSDHYLSEAEAMQTEGYKNEQRKYGMMHAPELPKK